MLAYYITLYYTSTHNYYLLLHTLPTAQISIIAAMIRTVTTPIMIEAMIHINFLEHFCKKTSKKLYHKTNSNCMLYCTGPAHSQPWRKGVLFFIIKKCLLWGNSCVFFPDFVPCVCVCVCVMLIVWRGK